MICRPEVGVVVILIFFFQAEDGIRDHCVTGVQTCALPISSFRISPAITTCHQNLRRTSRPERRELRDTLRRNPLFGRREWIRKVHVDQDYFRRRTGGFRQTSVRQPAIARSTCRCFYSAWHPGYLPGSIAIPEFDCRRKCRDLGSLRATHSTRRLETAAPARQRGCRKNSV